jgi:hypothetical protein
MITLVLYIGSLTNLATWFPCGRGRTQFILGSLPLYRSIIYIDGHILWCTHFLLMIKLQLINADIIYDTAIVMSQVFLKSFNCRYNPRMDYAFCLLTLKNSEKWRSPLFGATYNFNDQILPYGILFLTCINTNVFYLMSFKFSR